MRVHVFVDEGLGHTSYVIDLDGRVAAIVDPPRFPIAQEALLDQCGLTLAWTIDTHSHADYVTGSPALAARRDATFIAPAASRLATPHRPVHDRERVALGAGVELVTIATPGHTPDHCAYVVAERGEPTALFSGGSLMVGTVGRTDLCGPDLAVPLAQAMFRSLRRFDDLPDDLVLYPTHGAGSFCSAPGASPRTSTLRSERETNPLFSITDENTFVERLVGGFGTFPSYFARLPELNRRGPTRYDSLPPLRRLSIDEFNARVGAGALVIDVRPFARFGAAHIPGSLSITLRPVFASWLGWLVAADREVAFVLDPDQDASDLVRQCLDVGHEHLAGELDGGIGTWISSNLPVATIPVVDVAHLAGLLIDVRQADEYTAGHVPGSTNTELAAITIDAPAGGPVTVMCGHGERAMTAASILAAGGHRDVSVFDGGPDTWATAADLPLEVGT